MFVNTLFSIWSPISFFLLGVLNADAHHYHTTSLIISQGYKNTSEHYTYRLLVNVLQHKTEVKNC